MGYFKGFTDEGLDFLQHLCFNNNKTWFDEHREIYRQLVLEPMQFLVMDLSETMALIDPLFELRPSVSKTISRINRDTRFSKDKSPYRSNIWCTFKRASKEWASAPAFFFDITPNTYSYGMGFYMVDKETMDRFRRKISEETGAFKEAISFYNRQKTFVLEGDQYKRILKPELEPELQEWYQRKNLYLICTRTINNQNNSVMSSELVDELKNGFNMLSGFYTFLYQLK